MRYKIEYETTEDPTDVETMLNLHGKVYKIKKVAKSRTDAQNRSIHLWCGLQAKAWNESGYDMMTVLKNALGLSWSSDSVKEVVWRKVQIATLQKESTTGLDTDEVSKVHKSISTGLGNNNIPVVQFPNRQDLDN